ncbi:major facilitator superfamily protein [Pseudohyphozyma bogoriensis]|nr:major facilitator superfamily protein [Pseudohyphozyma bogoriensis]
MFASSSTSTAAPAAAPAQSSLSASKPTEATKSVFRLGTRESKLAMAQAVTVKASIEGLFPGLEVQICGMTTTGDNNQSQPLYLMGGKALWTKELEVSLLEGKLDAIVHCLKDMPTELPEGCELGAILEREDPSDALVVKAGLEYKSLEELPDGSVIGTSSVRRVAQLRRVFPRLKFADLRGNLQTRLRKLDDPNSSYTAIILASAGLIRMGLADRITTTVTSPSLYHAVGQGALAIEMRSGDPRAAHIVGALEDWKTGWTTRAERSMLKILEGGCSVPVGCESFLVEEVDVALCPVAGAPSAPTSPRIDAHFIRNGISNGLPPGHPSPKTSPHDPHSATLTLTGTITSLAGTSFVIASSTRLVHSIAEAEALGAEIARELVIGGGREILQELGRHVKEVTGVDGQEIPMVGNNARPSNGIDMPPPAKNLVCPVTHATSPKSPHRTVFREGEVCLRPMPEAEQLHSPDLSKDMAFVEEQGSLPYREVEILAAGSGIAPQHVDVEKLAAGKDEKEQQEVDEAALPKGFKLIMIMAALVGVSSGFPRCVRVLSEFLAGLDQTVIAAGVPQISNDFDALQDIGWYGSAYLLACCSLMPLFGSAYAYFAKKWVFLGSLVVFEVASLVSAVAHTSRVFIFGRALQGVGYAGIFIGVLAIGTASLPLHLQPIFTYGLGAAIGPLIGGTLVTKVSWRWCFYVNLPPGFASVFIVGIFCNPPRIKQTLSLRARLLKMDWGGSILLLGASACLLLALQDGGILHPWNSPRIFGLLIGFGLIIVVFFGLQGYLKDRASILMRLLGQRNVAFLSLYNAMSGATYYSLLYYIPIYFQAVQGSSALTSGVQMLANIIPIVSFSVISGWTASKFGFVWNMYGGMLFTAAGAGLLATMGSSTPVGQWIGYQIVAGVGMGASYMQSFIATQVLLPPEDKSAASSIVVFWQLFGATIWVSASQSIYQCQLLKGIQKIPGIDVQAVIGGGVSSFRDTVPAELLDPVIEVAVKSLFDVFLACAVLGAVGFFAVIGVERKRIEKVQSDK